MKRAIYYFTVKDGKIILDQRVLFDLYVKSLKEGTRGEMVLEDITKDKTLPQLRYYHGVIVKEFSEKTGYSKEECDGILKRRFLTVNKGTDTEYVRSKATLTCEEMKEFIDQCIQYLAENGIPILPCGA